jgi:hypothetical protein
MDEMSVLDALRRSSFVFAGTVTAETGSSLRILPARPGLAVVRLERGFVINPVLGKLDGRPITVRLAQNRAGGAGVRSGQRVLFFATAWVHGEEIAVSEVIRLPADEKTEQEVAQIVASLPERHLSERIAMATLIVHGTVTDISPATDVPGIPSEHNPEWMRAVIRVQKVLKGKPESDSAGSPDGAVTLLFPGTHDRAFLNVPRPSRKQTAVFLLHRGSGMLPPGSLIAPDPADIQPEDELPTIRRLLGGSTAKR